MILFDKMTVLKRTVIWLSAITFVTFSFMLFIGLEVRETIRNNGLIRIHSILNHKLASIDNYVHQRYTSLDNFTELFYFASRHHPIFDKDFWNHSPETLRSKLSIIAKNNGLYDVFLINVDGDIVYTVKREADLHSNLFTGRYRDSQLAQVFKDALKNTVPYVSDFYFYEPSKDYGAFIAKAILHDGKIIGIAAVQIDSKEIQAVMNDRSELGKTGEVMISILQNGKIKSMFSTGDIQKLSPVSFGSSYGKPLHDSVHGQSGQKYITDNTGKNSAVSWGYQKDFRCGLIIKMDENELLHEWYKQITSMVLLFLFGVIFVFSMIIIALQSLAKPIGILSQHAQMISNGQYDIEIKSTTYDHEWQLLINAFQQMAIEIKRKMTQLHDANRELQRQKNEIEELNQTLEERIRSKTHMLQKLAITDPMTDLYNRRHYITIVQEEMNRAKRHNTTMALMMLDVDFFKHYNDTYGHQAGDNVLIRIAGILKEYTSRSGDYAFRLGGEEFALLITNMSDEEYLYLGHRILNEVVALKILHEKNEASPYVTISMGIYIYYPEFVMTHEELYKEADDRLYLAKDRGRNQIAVLY